MAQSESGKYLETHGSWRVIMVVGMHARLRLGSNVAVLLRYRSLPTPLTIYSRYIFAPFSFGFLSWSLPFACFSKHTHTHTPLLLARYAIKKVVFRGVGVSNPRAQAVMREVQCLAQLDHKNIVRYHTSWLESSWVENGMGHQHADSAAASKSAAAANNTGSDVSLRSRMNALVPAHMQSELIQGLETMVRSGDSASGSGSGWGWGAESHGDFDGDAGFGGPGKKAVRGTHQGSGSAAAAAAAIGGGGGGGGGRPWDSRGGDHRRDSMSPQVRSPRNLIVPLHGRERGFSRWSAEDLESETSRWSESSSWAGLNDYEDPFAAAAVGGGTTATAATTASSRLRGGGGGAPAAARANAARRWVPQSVRTLRSEQFRNPSIDMDDLVSFGNSSSSPAAGGGDDGDVSAAQGVVEDSSDEDISTNGWRESDILDGGGGGRGRGDRRTSGGRGRRAERRVARHSISPDRLVQYPVGVGVVGS